MIWTILVLTFGIYLGQEYTLIPPVKTVVAYISNVIRSNTVQQQNEHVNSNETATSTGTVNANENTNTNELGYFICPEQTGSGPSTSGSQPVSTNEARGEISTGESLSSVLASLSSLLSKKSN